MFSMCAGGHLQGAQRGPLRIFEFLELFASIARSRSRSPNDIVSANSCNEGSHARARVLDHTVSCIADDFKTFKAATFVLLSSTIGGNGKMV